MEKILLTDIHGDIWTFESHKRLCYTKNHMPTQVLLGESSNEFDIITDEKGNFHIVTQDTEGNMVYFTYDFTNWKKYTILRSKSGKINMHGFKMFIRSGIVHCFYILESNHKNMLIHHTFSPADDVTTPKVIDCIGNGNFSCAMDESANIHIFYINENEKSVYKIYKDGKYAEEVLPDEESVRGICCIYAGRIHLIYTAKMKSYRTIIYYNPESKERKIINFSDGNISDCAIYGYDNSVYIQWMERMRLYQCVSDDGGKTFKKPMILSKKEEFVRVRNGANPHVMGVDRSAGYNISIPKENTHIQKEKTYNKTDEIDALRKAIMVQNEKIIQLENEIKKLKNMKKPDTELKSKTIGEINEENYKAFQSADIDNIDFENSKIFNKE